MNLSELKEALHRIKTEPEWTMLWDHLLEARNGCMQRFMAVTSWEQFVEIRGEINALNDFLEFGDMMLDRLEEAQVEADANAGRRENGRS